VWGWHSCLLLLLLLLGVADAEQGLCPQCLHSCLQGHQPEVP
jgi:hypothetical protein